MQTKSQQRILTAVCTGLVTWSGIALPTDARPLYTHFLFFPDKRPHDEISTVRGVAKQEVFFKTEGGAKIHGWFFRSNKSPDVVLVNHGNSGNISSVLWIADLVLSSGASVFLYDYRGYGLSPGEPSVDSICADGLAAYDYLTNKQHFSPDKVILYGQSLGCAVACHILSQRHAKGVILQSGFSSLRAVASQRFPFLKSSSLIPDALDNASILERAHPPLLLIHGEDDKTVPVQNSLEMFRRACGNKELVLMPRTGHRVEDNPLIHELAVSQFLSKLLTDALSSAATSAAR